MTQDDDYKKYLATQLLSAAIAFGEIAKVSDDPAFIRECLDKAERAFAEAISVNRTRTPDRSRMFRTRSARVRRLIMKMQSRLEAPG
jgi:hypothetical protein